MGLILTAVGMPMTFGTYSASKCMPLAPDQLSRLRSFAQLSGERL
jgi:hypothetical protein